MRNLVCGILFWLVSLTWGLISTLLGFIVFCVVVLFAKGKVHRNGYTIIVEFGGNWGGLSLGAFNFCGRYSQENGPCYDIDWYEHTRRHEFGHSLQNLIWGPLMIFVIGIPSATRYWYQTLRIRKGLDVKPYESIWFEGQATCWGSNSIDSIE